MLHDSYFVSPKTRWPAVSALAVVESGMRVLVGSGAAVPSTLVEALGAHADALRDVEVCHLMTLGPSADAITRARGHLRHNAFFAGAETRDAIEAGDADFTPVLLSDLARRFDGELPIDVALVQATPPDEHGFCSLGVSVDIVKPAIAKARFVIAELNPRMPRTLGDAFVHVSRFTHCVDVDHPIPELRPGRRSEVDEAIGKHVASIIRDGDTLQIGIGSIPDTVLANLRGHKDLGVHSEMFSDGVVDLVHAGVVTNARKSLHRGKLVASFVMGTNILYDFVDDNPAVEMHPSHYVNDPFVIAQNRAMVAINSALSVDLTGQVCADSIGGRFYSGAGGQVDFVRGAARSEDGRSIIALPSTAKEGEVSRIVAELAAGSGVTTTRSEVCFVVTEYGIAALRGRSVRERAAALVKIAHPRFRDALAAEAKRRRWA